MKVYVVQYHDNSWGAQMSEDSILGIYSNLEAAEKRAEEFEENFVDYDDDVVFVTEYEIDKAYD